MHACLAEGLARHTVEVDSHVLRGRAVVVCLDAERALQFEGRRTESANRRVSALEAVVAAFSTLATRVFEVALHALSADCSRASLAKLGTKFALTSFKVKSWMTERTRIFDLTIYIQETF